MRRQTASEFERRPVKPVPARLNSYWNRGLPAGAGRTSDIDPPLVWSMSDTC